MLAAAIKNTILVILIMLILHFLLKNILLDKQPLKIPEKFTPANFIEKQNNQDLCIGKRLDDSEKKNLQESEMKKYIGLIDDNALDNFFQDNALSNEVRQLEEKLKDQPNVCKFKADNHQLPLSSTCDANIQSLGQDNNMKIVKECDVPQDKKNIMILKEYADEKAINGGTLYDGLSAYDNLDITYEMM